ncbi:MAG: hypothetical protein ACMXYL_02685 [Candidatus Woesearchaeota archaeon]
MIRLEISKDTLIFDTGPIITFAITSILPNIMGLKEYYNGDFIIPKSVEKELIDRPLATKKFRLEALQVLHQIQGGAFKVYDSRRVQKLTREIMGIANSTFKAKGNWIRIVSHAEVSVLASAIELHSNTIVVDERTMRLLVEEPCKVGVILEKKLHTPVDVNKKNIRILEDMTRNINVIRSSELALVAYEKGLLDDYIINSKELVKSGITHHKVERPEKLLAEALLWAIKLNGCSISKREILEAVKISTTKKKNKKA